MQNSSVFETIAVHLTPHGKGAVSVWLLDGPFAVEAANSFLKGNISEYAPCVPHLNVFLDKGQPLDELLVVVVPGEKSPTRNLQVELHFHGAPAIDRAVRDIVSRCVSGRSPKVADISELERRRFVVGTADILEIESERALRNASSERSVRFFSRQLAGELSGAVNEIIERIDSDVNESARLMDVLIGRKEGGLLAARMPVVVVAGRPNVGKSSIMNRILGADRSVVSAVRGTTRDSVSGWLSCGGLPAVIIDTAGIRANPDEKESLGIARAMEAVRGADLCLAVFDGSELLQDDDIALIKKMPSERSLYFINKSDLPLVLPTERLGAMGVTEYEQVSALTGAGFEKMNMLIKERIESLFPSELLERGAGAPFTARQVSLLESAREALPEKSGEAKNLLKLMLYDGDFFQKSAGESGDKT